jgi:hypothetical protein
MEKDSFDNDGNMIPPWTVFPTIPFGSLGWKMGNGELYLIRFNVWFSKLDKMKKQEYVSRYPKPEDWKSFYPYNF